MTLPVLFTEGEIAGFGIRSVLMKHEAMTLGNFIGSIAINSLFILGLVAIINPIIIEDVYIIGISGFFLAVALIIFNIFIRTKNRFNLREGLILLSLYFIFLIVQIFIR